jgi:hypothetical protein
MSTIGAQRRYNYALQPMSKAACMRLVTADQPEAQEGQRQAAALVRQQVEQHQQNAERLHEAAVALRHTVQLLC